MEKNNKITNFNFFISVPALLWQLIFLILPLLFIIFIGLYPINKIFEFINYAHFIIILRTILVSLISSFLCLIIAYPVAYFLAFRSKNRNYWLTFLMLPLWVNFLVQVYSWFFLLEQKGLINKILIALNFGPLHLINNNFAIILVMIHVYLPFMIMPLYNVLEKFDFSLIEASGNLGANSWQTFRKITLPLSLSGVYLGFFLVFVMCFGEVAIPILVGGNKNLFVGTLISEYFLKTRDVHAGAFFTLLSTIALVISLIFFYYLLKRKAREI